MDLIRFENVDFTYKSEDENDVTVLRDFNLNVEQGSFVALLGHNGSGKSTVAKLANGILFPEKGCVYVDGQQVTDDDSVFDVRKKVGMVFQNPDNQIVASIVEEDVAFGAENLGLPPDEIRIRVDDALKRVGMYEHKDKAPHKLSGGQKQRVAVAGIIAMKPKCIMLDEPTAMLDPSGRREVIETIKMLNREEGITIILITHYMDEAVQADRVVVIDNGEIRLDGTPNDVFKNVDRLKSMGLDVPQSAELIHNMNFKTDKTILNADDCADYIFGILEG